MIDAPALKALVKEIGLPELERVVGLPFEVNICLENDDRGLECIVSAWLPEEERKPSEDGSPLVKMSGKLILTKAARVENSERIARVAMMEVDGLARDLKAERERIAAL